MRGVLRGVLPYLAMSSRVIVGVFLVVVTAVFIIHGILSVAFRYPLDYGEAPLVDQAVRLLARESIYQPDLTAPPYTISNYPPLYPLMLVPGVWLFGPAFGLGRLLSVLSALASAVALGGIVRTHTGQRAAVWVTATTFLAWPYVLEWSGRARVDLLALVLSCWALYVVSRWQGERWAAVIAGLLLVGAVYTRQSYGLAAPLAAGVWLWHRGGWRQALRLGTVTVVTGVVILLAVMVATGGGFWTHIVTANVNPFSFDLVKHYGRGLLDVAPVMLTVGGAVLLFGAGRLAVWPLLAPYLIGALASAVTIGKVGSNVNYLLELCAALSLSAGLGVAWLGCTEDDAHAVVGLWRQVVGFVLAVVVMAQAGSMLSAGLQGPVQTLKGRRQAERPLAALEAEIGEIEAPVLADEHMGLLTLQGRRLALQPFERTQLALAGQWDQGPLLAQIRNQEFALVMIHHFEHWPVYRERWTPEMLGEVMTAYEAARFVAGTVVFEPRRHVALSMDAACPGVPWSAPTRADFGVWWLSRQLGFMGEGVEGTLPVVAVADGELLRRPGWGDAVAVLHEDPLVDGRLVWTYYGNMGDGSEEGSLVNPAYPPGTEGVAVARGDHLGYQGRTWESEIGWVHLRFAIVPAPDSSEFPDASLDLDGAGETPALLDPGLYLGTGSSPVMGQPVWLPYRCEP